MKTSEIKTLLLFHGINIDDTLKKEVFSKFDCMRFKINRVFLNIVGIESVPLFVRIRAEADAYILHRDLNKYYVCIENETIYLEFNECSKAYSSCISNGKQIGDVLRLKGNRHLAITLNHYCKYLSTNNQCRFCNIQSWPTNTHSEQRNYIEAIKAYYELSEIDHISITGGTLAGDDKGLNSIINFIRDFRREGILLPVAVECEPIYDKKYFMQLLELGVCTVSINYELISSEGRKQLMPGKGKISLEDYIKSWSLCVDVFGKNQVYSNILLSCYDDEGDNSNVLKKIVSCGVIPSIGLLLSNNESEHWMMSKNLLKQIYYYEKNAVYLHKAELNPLLAKAGCPRNGAYSPINEYYTDLLDKSQSNIK